MEDVRFLDNNILKNICPFQRREAEGRVGAHKNLFVQPR